MSNSCKRNAKLGKSFRVMPEENDLLLSAAKRKGLGISTFCKIAALEATGQQTYKDTSRPVGPHSRAIGEMIAAACIVQRLLSVTAADNSAKAGAVHHDEILDACTRIIAAANDLIGDAS